LNKTKKFKEEEEDEWFTNTFPGCFSKDVKESLRIVKESCLFLGGGGGGGEDNDITLEAVH